jgi:hypothetical protein
MQAFLLYAASAAVLVGLGALVEAARSWRGRTGRKAIAASNGG